MDENLELVSDSNSLYVLDEIMAKHKCYKCGETKNLMPGKSLVISLFGFIFPQYYGKLEINHFPLCSNCGIKLVHKIGEWWKQDNG